ncbi:hypothetical protein [Kluyvera sichuanensis]|uniref:hypothetical protein n=1 Tax=Kluyvera sichuanensis TaxID=2725494 RepID=UPI003F678BFE
MKKILFCAVLVTMLAGCTSPKYNYMPSVQNISEPPIGTTNTAYVGDSLLKQGVMSKYDGLKVTAPARVSWAYTVTTGYLKKVGDDEKNEYYMPLGTAESANVDKAALADMWQGIMAKKGTNTLCVITVFAVSVCEDNMPIQRTPINIASDNNFQQTLIYNGRVGNKINVGYREMSSNMARPAFNNDVEYDLSESKTIGYKGARLEIIEATNQSLKYKLISNFN